MELVDYDWEIGFQSEVKLHKTPTKKDIENGYRENEEALLLQFIMYNMVKNGDASSFFRLWLYNEVCNKRIESIICERI